LSFKKQFAPTRRVSVTFAFQATPVQDPLGV
jgi:hypothetical protein